jgi:hypothetical protein
MIYEETKQRKLKRLLGLRIANVLGTVAWRDDSYSEAKQLLRLIHPLTWVWIVIMVIYGTVMQGVPATVRDIRYSLKYDTVWF